MKAAVSKILMAVIIILVAAMLLMLPEDMFGDNMPSYYTPFCFNLPFEQDADSDIFVQFIRENTQETSNVYSIDEWIVPTKRVAGIDGCVMSAEIGSVPEPGVWLYRARICKINVRGMQCIDSKTVEYVYPKTSERLVFEFKP